MLTLVDISIYLPSKNIQIWVIFTLIAMGKYWLSMFLAQDNTSQCILYSMNRKGQIEHVLENELTYE